MNLLKALGPYSKSVAALITYAISFVVEQETLAHPFTGNWWVGLLTGAGVVMGVFGVPNTPTATVTVNPSQGKLQ